MKGLLVLQTLARMGESSALALSASTGIPRPTVHRLLRTLVDAGYVNQERRGGGYRLTGLVAGLADAFKDDDWLLGAAGPVLDDLRHQVAWPTDVAICNGGSMVIWASTHDQNPLSLDRVVRGRRVSMLTSALGRAYLAYCPPAEREGLLRSLKPANALEREVLSNLELLHRELDATRARGYGLRERGSQPKTSSIAVPVMNGEWVVACLNIHWISRAMSTGEAVSRYLRPLQEAAKRFESQYAAYRRRARRIR
ncbi:IclR family transcriptional regulator C-terminal domain-containing protein [Piscinibacter sp.]|uniref:IclR family transcriptional regulator domain-containing protein n=1 Tax=Piscinibacter sp. TaxID=1903157 RepID=UPI0039E2F81B